MQVCRMEVQTSWGWVAIGGRSKKEAAPQRNTAVRVVSWYRYGIEPPFRFQRTVRIPSGRGRGRPPKSVSCGDR